MHSTLIIARAIMPNLAKDGWQRMLEWFKQYGGKKSL